MGRRGRIGTGIAVALLTSAVLGGCGGAAAPGPPGASQAVEDYVAALTDGRYRVMTGLSTGPAQLYAEYLVTGERSVNGGATAPVLQELVLEDAEVEQDRVRVTGEARLGGDGGTTRLRDFELVREGERWLLADYTRDGRPLSHFVAVADAKASADGLVVTGDLAFRDPSAGSLAVPVTIANDRSEDVEVRSYEARFAPTGSTRAHRIDFTGPGRIPAGSSVELVLIFVTVDDAEDGGRITMTLRAADGDIEVEQPLSVPAFVPR